MIKHISNTKEFKDTFNNNSRLIQVGTSKIFMKDEVKIYLECKLNQVYSLKTVKIQAAFRMKKQMSKIIKLKFKSIIIQKYYRGVSTREK